MKCSGVDLRSMAELSGAAYAKTISQDLTSNPYLHGSNEFDEWVRGFTSEKEAINLARDLWKQSQEKF